MKVVWEKLMKSLLCLLVTTLVVSSPSFAQKLLPSEETAALLEENSKLFSQFETVPSVDQILSRTPPANSFLALSRDAFSLHKGLLNTDKSREAYLMSAASNADLIVIAEPLKRTCALTAGHSFLFSEFTFAVDSILKSTEGITVLPGQHLIVSRAGGVINYRNIEIRASTPSLPPFQLGNSYILFLRVQENGTFTIFGTSAYDIVTPQITTHWLKGKPLSSVSKSDFMQDLQNALQRVKREDAK